jgi:ComF family protein
MNIIKDLFEAFFPFRCHVCLKLTSLGEVLCLECEKRLSDSLRRPLEFSDTVCDFPLLTLSEYNSFVADVIKLIKYRPSKKLLDCVVKIIVQKRLLANFVNRKLVFVPVPMHFSRKKERGFNQAAILAQGLAEKTGNYFSPLIERSIATKPQASCGEDERLVNLDSAFCLQKGIDRQKITHKTLYIVDDVATTGTTINKCKEVLNELKPAKVSALVLSHSFKRS